MNLAARRYDYPDYVCQYIKENWVKINDDNGGTYQKPAVEEEKTFGTQYKNTSFYEGKSTIKLPQSTEEVRIRKSEIEMRELKIKKRIVELMPLMTRYCWVKVQINILFYNNMQVTSAFRSEVQQVASDLCAQEKVAALLLDPNAQEMAMEVVDRVMKETGTLKIEECLAVLAASFENMPYDEFLSHVQQNLKGGAEDCKARMIKHLCGTMDFPMESEKNRQQYNQNKNSSKTVTMVMETLKIAMDNKSNTNIFYLQAEINPSAAAPLLSQITHIPQEVYDFIRQQANSMLMLTDQAEEIDWFDYKSPKSKQAMKKWLHQFKDGEGYFDPKKMIGWYQRNYNKRQEEGTEIDYKLHWLKNYFWTNHTTEIDPDTNFEDYEAFQRQVVTEEDQAEAQWEEEFENYSLQQLIDWYKANALSADANKLNWVAQEIEEDERMNGQAFDPIGSYDFPEKDFREEDEPLRKPSKKSLGDDEAFVLPDPGERSPVFKKFGTYMIWILLLLASSMSFSNQVSTQRVGILPERPGLNFPQIAPPPTMDLGNVNDTPLGPNLQFDRGTIVPLSETAFNFGKGMEVTASIRQNSLQFNNKTMADVAEITQNATPQKILDISDDQNTLVELNDQNPVANATKIAGYTGGLFGMGNLLSKNDINKTAELVSPDSLVLDDKSMAFDDAFINNPI